MKPGDLVRRRKPKGYWRNIDQDWVAIVTEIKESNGYLYPRFVILKTGEIDSCSGTLLEVISESR
jgi:hypothetical protein